MDFHQAMATALTMRPSAVGGGGDGGVGGGSTTGGQIAVVGSDQQFNKNGSMLAHVLPNHAAGHFARMMVQQFWSSVTTAEPVFTGPAGWEEVDDFSFDYGQNLYHKFAIYERAFQSSGEASPTVSSDTSSVLCSNLIVLSGVDVTEPADTPYVRANHFVGYSDEVIGNFVPRPITTQYNGSALLIWNPLTGDGFTADLSPGFSVERSLNYKGYRNYATGCQLDAGTSGVKSPGALRHTGFSQQNGAIFTFALKSVEPV